MTDFLMTTTKHNNLFDEVVFVCVLAFFYEDQLDEETEILKDVFLINVEEHLWQIKRKI